MKKIFKIISLVMMMVMCFSVTAFAAETDETSNLKVSFTDEGMINTVDEDVTPEISVRAPAPAVSSVKVVAAQIKSDGYVYVTVQVAGYGKNIYATYDGSQCYVSSTTSVGRPIVTGYLYEVKCAMLQKKNKCSKEGERCRTEEKRDYRRSCIYWQTQQNMMWRVHPAVLHEKGRRDFWEIPAQQGSVTALHRMADVFLF